MESTTSSGPRLPPGFRFHPTDEELLVHYLKKKAASDPLPVAIIAEVDLYKYDPWELPSKASFGEQEWYFFSPRERKYPNGERPNRAATSGYWKATGTDKPILTANGAQKIGVKKALVFYGGKPPKGIKTNWIMHEYRLLGDKSAAGKPPARITLANNKKASLRLDDWVLCRIFKKINSSTSRSMEEGLLPPTSSMDGYSQQNSNITGGYHGNNIFYSGGMLPENGSEIHNIDPTISNISSSKSDFSKHVYSSEYWNGMSTNGTMVFSSNNQWECGDEDDHGSNPRSSSSSIDHQRNMSYISLLNQQYHPQIFHQNSIVNNTPGDGILDQSYQLPNSQIQ